MMPKSAADKAKSDFNAFLNTASKRGELKVQHVRVRSRQPQNETFARKAAIAVRRLAPHTQLSFSTTELSGSSAKTGVAELGAAAAQVMTASREYAAYLTPKPSPTPSAGAKLELFAILSAYAGFELSKRLGATPALQSGAVSVVGATNGLLDKLPQKLASAADSVFAQSFADVYAIRLRAAVDGKDAALADLDAVTKARAGSGDFTLYSLAPLSHDTQDALLVLRSQLKAGIDFGSKGSDEVFQNSMMAAREGLAAWMQRHGVEFKAASTMTAGLESMVDMAATAALRLDAPSRMVPRPH